MDVPEQLAVIAGGPSSEHAVSLQTGTTVVATLAAAGRVVRPVLVTRQGGWIVGEPAAAPDAARPAGASAASAPTAAHACWNALAAQPAASADDAIGRLAASGEVAFLALHGRFGEDGQVQRLLAAAGVPFTGSGAIPSALCFDKDLTKVAAARLGARCAPHEIVDRDEVPVRRLERVVGRPCVVKPVCGGSSVATAIVRPGESDERLIAAVTAARREDTGGRAMVEGFVDGTEVTAAVLRAGGAVRALPLVAIEAVGDPFYDYHAKYESEATRLVCPARIDAAAAREIERLGLELYERLELSGVVRLDLLVPRDGSRPVFLEVNTLPGLTSHSLVPLAARTAGMSMLELLDAVLADAVAERAA